MKKTLALAAALFVAVAVAACGGSAESGESTAKGESGKTFPLLTWGDLPVERADTVTSSAHPTLKLLASVLQGVMTYDKNGKLIPGLASSVSNPNPTTYIYTFKKNATFSDGKPLTMEDVVFSLRRNMSAESTTAVLYEDVAAIRQKTANSIEISLKKPEAQFPYLLATAGQIIEKDAAEAGGLSKIGTPGNLPVGTGPYKLVSFNPRVGATLVPNEHWQGQSPLAEKVEVKFLSDDSAFALAMRSGELDGVFEALSQRTFDFDGAEILASPGTAQIAISMNTIVAPYDDIHLRKAIAYATDREGMAQAMLDGAAEISNTLTPISLYGNIAPTTEVDASFGQLPEYEFNLEKAEAELAKSAYADGLTISFVTEPATVKVAQVLAPDLEAIGIKVDIDQKTEAAYGEMLLGPRDKIGITTAYYGATAPDPTSLMTYYLSPSEAKVNGLNSANYTNPQVARLLNEQAQESDGQTRLNMITELFTKVQEDVPYVPLFSPEYFGVISDKFVFNEFSVWTTDYRPWLLDIEQAG